MTETEQAPASESPSYKPEAIAERFREMMNPNSEPITKDEPKPEVKPEVKSEPKEKVEQEIPDSLITGKTDDPDESLMRETPKGPLKHENWSRLQKKAQEWEAKAREFEEKLKNPTIPETFKNDFETTKAKLAEREAIIERIAVERSEKFQNLFTSKESAIKETFNATAKDLQIDEDQAQVIFNSKGKKRYELIDDLDIPQSAKSDLTVMLRQKDELGSQKESFLSKSREELNAWEEQNKSENDARLAKLKEHEDRIFETKLSELVKSSPMLQKIEGNEKWNAVVDQNIAEARRFFSGKITAEEAADYAIAGATAKQVFKMFEVARERLQAANEELSRLKAAAPTVENPSNKVSDDDSKLGLAERAMKTFQKMAQPKNSGW